MDVWVVWDGSDVWDVLQCVLGAIILEIVDDKIPSCSEQMFSNAF